MACVFQKRYPRRGSTKSTKGKRVIHEGARRPRKHFHEGPRRTAKGHEGVGGGSRGLRQRSPRGERISTKRQKHELFAKFATGQAILPANVMFCLFQYRVRPGEKCGFTTKSTKVTKRIFRNPSRDAGCEDIHAGRRPSAGSDHTKPARLGRFSSFRSFCVFVPFVAIPGKDPAAAFCKRLICSLIIPFVVLRGPSWISFFSLFPSLLV